MFKIPPDAVTWSLPAAEQNSLDLLPSDQLSALLRQFNGFILFEGALHVRGLVEEPKWHSLANAWCGESALWRSYRSLSDDDIPFGQDCVGDQYILRREQVGRLSAETDELELLGLDLVSFVSIACDDPDNFLSTSPLAALGQALQPGQLVDVAPPFVMKHEGEYSFRAAPAPDRLSFLADLAAQVRDVPEGERVQFKIVRNERDA